jgi:hypothetical protein
LDSIFKKRDPSLLPERRHRMPEYEDEEVGMSLKKLSVAIAIAGTAAFATSEAFADDAATWANCLHMSEQVSTTLDANKQSPNYQTARVQESNGHMRCSSGQYAQGIEFYQKALDLVGQAKN